MDFTVHWLPRIRSCCDTHFVRCINTSFTFICQVVLRVLRISFNILNSKTWYYKPNLNPFNIEIIPFILINFRYIPYSLIDISLY